MMMRAIKSKGEKGKTAIFGVTNNFDVSGLFVCFSPGFLSEHISKHRAQMVQES